MKNIVLIGPSGIGKTTIGKYISKMMNKKLIDTDNEVEKYEKRSIEKIFEISGEKYFRKLEENIIEKACDMSDVVIATGGGVVLSNANMEMLKKSGIIFLLYGSIDTIINNLKKSDIERPLLKSNNIYDRVEQMLNDREYYYFKNADYIINVDNKSIDEIGKEIVYILEKN